MSVTNLFDVSGRRVFVSGASSGLGRRAAILFADAGAHVIAAARRAGRLNELVREIETAGGRAEAVVLNVADADSVVQAIDAAWAGGGVDVLINSAGAPSSSLLLESTEAEFDATFDVNVKGLWRTSVAFARRKVAEKKPGVIVNFASMLALSVHPRESLYCASKAAVLQLTRSMAIEFTRYNIRTNALCPGYFESEMTGDFLRSEAGTAYIARTPARRAGRVDELDGALLFLASDASSFMNGAHLVVDGGQTARII